VIKLLQRAAKQFGAAVICVTHDTRLEAFADRVIHLEDGMILSDRRVDHTPPPANTDHTGQPALVGA
jgi:putative ABC transport system ATP-binding protein